MGGCAIHSSARMPSVPVKGKRRRSYYDESAHRAYVFPELMSHAPSVMAKHAASSAVFV